MDGNPLKYLYYVVLILFGFLIALPVIYTLAAAVADTGSNIHYFSFSLFQLLLKSVAVAFSVSFISTVTGTIAAFLVYKTNIPLRSFFKIILLVPLFLSPYILAVAWKDILFEISGKTGLLSPALGVISVLSITFTPLVFLITGSAFSGLNSAFEEAGLMITGKPEVLSRITLPLIKHAIITSFVLVFIFSISEFSVPALFGLKVLTVEIFTQFAAFYNHSLAILQSLLLVLVCVLLLYGERKYISGASFLSLGNKGKATFYYDLNKWSFLGVLFLFILFSAGILLPVTMLFFQAFEKGSEAFFQAFLLLKQVFFTSLLLSFQGALIITVTGLISALYTYKHSHKSSFFRLDNIMLVIFAIPSTVFGIALIKFYNTPLLGFIYSGTVIIIMGYVGKYSFISAKLTENALKQIPASLFDAARVEGVPFFRFLTGIVVPLILPALFAAFTVGFIFSFGELGTTIMVYPPGTELIPVKVFTIMANAPQSLTSSMSLIVLLVTLGIISVFYAVMKLILKKYNFDR